jgi:coenzyme PQQ precursor peptide PqqA
LHLDVRGIKWKSLIGQRFTLFPRGFAISFCIAAQNCCKINRWRSSRTALLYIRGRKPSRSRRRMEMSWKTPKIVEVPVGMEINMYACAARK